MKDYLLILCITVLLGVPTMLWANHNGDLLHEYGPSTRKVTLNKPSYFDRVPVFSIFEYNRFQWFMENGLMKAAQNQLDQLQCWLPGNSWVRIRSYKSYDLSELIGFEQPCYGYIRDIDWRRDLPYPGHILIHPEAKIRSIE